jgi:uncharacterized membrane protein YciS (DUF1049 family)
LSRAQRSAGGLVRRIVAVLILVPLAVVIIAFAMANRQEVTVSFDPFASAPSAFVATTWLFVPIIAALILGVAIGGFAAWLGHGKWRRAARRLEREVGVLRRELDGLKGAAAGGGPKTAAPAEPPERLRLKAPVR